MAGKNKFGINLLNFNDSEFYDSPYVLTSPRSLRACSKLNIKPVDLLTKSFEEFAMEKGEFERRENERKKKLNQCLMERAKIISRELKKKLSGPIVENDTDADRVVDHVQNLNQGRLTVLNSGTTKQQSDMIINNSNNSVDINTLIDNDRTISILRKRFKGEEKMSRRHLQQELMEQSQEDWKDEYELYLEIMLNKSDLISKQYFIRRRNKISEDNYRKFIKHLGLWNKIQHDRKEATNSIIDSIHFYNEKLETLEKERNFHLRNSRISNERWRKMREEFRKRRLSYDDFNEKDRQTKMELKVVYKNFDKNSDVRQHRQCKCF